MENTVEILSQSVISGIGKTLIHATWQLILVGIAYTVVRKYFQKSIKNKLSEIALFSTQILISTLTFFIVYTPVSAKKAPSAAEVKTSEKKADDQNSNYGLTKRPFFYLPIKNGEGC